MGARSIDAAGIYDHDGAAAHAHRLTDVFILSQSRQRRACIGVRQNGPGSGTQNALARMDCFVLQLDLRLAWL